MFRAIAVTGLALSTTAWLVSDVGSRHWWGFELLVHFRVLHFVLTVSVALVLIACAAIGNPESGSSMASRSGRQTDSPARVRGRRRWGVGFPWEAVAAVALAVALAIPLLPYWFGRTEMAPPAGRPVWKAMLLNLNLANRQVRQVENHIAAEDPDILLLQEVTPRWRDALSGLAARYPHRIECVRDDAFGIWLLSRLPLRNARVLDGAPDSVLLPALEAEIDVGQGMVVSFLGAHPSPPVGAAAAGRRNARLESVAAWAAEAGDPARDPAGEGIGGRVLVMGDLNCSPFSPHFRDMLRGGRLRDSALGRGTGATWFTGIPGLSAPIDHALVGEGIIVAARRIGPPVGSDHRSVVLEFVVGAGSG